MTWTVAHLLANPSMYQKALEEIDRASNPADGSEEHFPYLNQCIKETQRVTPAVISAPLRQFPEDRTLFGYKIPKSVPFPINSGRFEAQDLGLSDPSGKFGVQA